METKIENRAIRIFDGTNLHCWKYHMEIILDDKDPLELVDRRERKPATTSNTITLALLSFEGHREQAPTLQRMTKRF